MDQKTLRKDTALRLELALEIEERISKPFKKEIEGLTQSKQKLEQKLEILTESHAKLAAETILESEHLAITQDLSKKASALEFQLKEVNKKHRTLQDEASKIKSEHAALKHMDPVSLKKKLDDNKKKLKTKTQAVLDMTKDKVQLNKVVIKQQREIDSFKTLSEASNSDYLYESKCKSYQVIGTVFKSETHPFVVNGMNFRVVSQASGASYVVQWVDDAISFEEKVELPADVIEYVQNIILDSNADQE